MDKRYILKATAARVVWDRYALHRQWKYYTRLITV